MLTVYQMLQRINTEYPNSGFVYDPEVEHDTKVDQAFIDFINRALLRLDKYVLLDDIYEFPTIAGQCIYELPLNCRIENITDITRQIGRHTDIRLRYGSESEHLLGYRFWNAYGGMIGINPIPHKDDEKVTIFFKRTPMKVLTLDDPIEVDDRWIDLITYSVVADIASSGNNPDIEVANNYTMKYNNLLQEAMLLRNQKPYYSSVKDNKRPPLAFLRRGGRV